jgi:hypothetical protein
MGHMDAGGMLARRSGALTAVRGRLVHAVV